MRISDAWLNDRVIQSTACPIKFCLGQIVCQAMSISGHKTASVFQRYNIVDERDIMEAGRKLNEKQKSNALLEIPFGQSSGMISTKTGHSDHCEAAPQPALLPN